MYVQSFLPRNFNWMEIVVSGAAERIFDARCFFFLFETVQTSRWPNHKLATQHRWVAFLLLVLPVLQCMHWGQDGEARDWLYHREVLWNVPRPCLCYAPLRFSLSVLTWIWHLEDNPASGSFSLYKGSRRAKAPLYPELTCLRLWGGKLCLKTKGGVDREREGCTICAFELLSLYSSCTLSVSSGDARHGGGDVPWHPPAGRPDEGNQRPGRVRGPVHGDAPRHRGDLAHAVQLPVLLVGAGAWAPAPQHRALVHQGHLWTPQCHPGQHSENHQQQPEHRWGLLDEAHCRYHTCLSSPAPAPAPRRLGSLFFA